MRTASKATIGALAVLVSMWAMLAAGITEVWLTAEVRAFGLVMLPTAIVAAIVLFFDWRAKLFRSVRAERDTHRKAA